MRHERGWRFAAELYKPSKVCICRVLLNFGCRTSACTTFGGESESLFIYSEEPYAGRKSFCIDLAIARRHFAS
jgi:hypothetical protein